LGIIGEQLCYRAVAEGALSEAKTAELLGIGVRRLNDRLDHPEAAVSPARSSMTILVSDTSVLIDLERGELISPVSY
jgi:hypothetical protein